MTDKLLSIEEVERATRNGNAFFAELAKQHIETIRELENLKIKPAYEVMVEVIREKEVLMRENERLKASITKAWKMANEMKPHDKIAYILEHASKDSDHG